jgi:hypothetical protein
MFLSVLMSIVMLMLPTIVASSLGLIIKMVKSFWEPKSSWTRAGSSSGGSRGGDGGGRLCKRRRLGPHPGAFRGLTETSCMESPEWHMLARVMSLYVPSPGRVSCCQRVPASNGAKELGHLQEAASLIQEGYQLFAPNGEG